MAGNRATTGTMQTYLRDPGGVLLSKRQGSLYNYGRDRLGSTTALVDATGTVARTYAYDPWGQNIGTTGTTYNPFQYTGTYLDATGLYQMGARYYQPASGRFTQLDPLPKNLLTFDRYAYVSCNPANYIDPTGLENCEPFPTFVAGAATAVAAGYYYGAMYTAATAAVLTGPLAVGVLVTQVGFYLALSSFAYCLG